MTRIENANIDGLISPQSGWRGAIAREAQKTLGSATMSSVVHKGQADPEQLGQLDIALLEAAGYTPKEDLPNLK